MTARPSVLVLIGILLAPLPACRGAVEDHPNLVLFPDMFRSVSYKSYDPNPILAHGQTLQLPPEETVPMEGAPFPYGPGPEEAARAGRELRNPEAATPAVLLRGRKVFETICIVCHGPQGQGDGPIIGRFPNPPSLQADHAKGLSDGQIFHIISRGQGIMPSHASQVLTEDRWRVILYLHELQGTLPKQADGASPTSVGGGR